MELVLKTGLIIFGLLNLAFAGVVYAHNRKNIRVVFYALISVFASLWSVSTFLTDFEALNQWQFALAVYGHYVFGYLAYISFLWFSYLYPKPSGFPASWVVAVSIATISLLAFIPTGYFIISIGATGTIAERIVFNPLGYGAFIIMLSTVFFLGLWQLLAKLREASEPERYKDLDRNQIYFTVIEFFIAGTMGIVLNLVLPFYGNFDLFYICPIFLTMTLIGIGLYNLSKFHIFNAKIILAEFFTGGMIIVSIARVLLATSRGELITNSILLLATIAFGAYLIRSVSKEVSQREEIQRLAEDLRTANEKLKELDKMKSQFLSIASHDLRAPLTIIRNFISLTLDGSYGKLPKAAEEGLHQVFDRATDMTKSIDTYLNVSRIEQGKMKYDFIDVELAPIIKKAVADFKPNADAKKLTMGFVLDAGLEGRKARLDVAKVNEVLNNLLDNSIKYTPKGSISVKAERVGNIARITLQDTGVGMSKETIGKLFKLFSAGEQSLRLNVSSTGVGLYITKAHVEAHGGRIWAESDGEGRGSRFIVELPLLP